jgi:hypothetical protein
MADRPLDPVALDVLARSRLCDLRNDCDGVAALVAARELPIPELPDNAERRASKLLLLLQSRDRERRWQKLAFPGSEA